MSENQGIKQEIQVNRMQFAACCLLSIPTNDTDYKVARLIFKMLHLNHLTLRRYLLQ